MTIEIQLTRGYTATVDDCDADLAAFKWQASGSHHIYAKRHVMQDGKLKPVHLHHVIFERATGCEIPDGLMVDHRDLNQLNNRRDNLRLATNGQNRANTARQKNNTSGYKGAYWRKDQQRWRAIIRVNGRNISLGNYSTAQEAHAAYCEAAKKHHGEFARFE